MAEPRALSSVMTASSVEAKPQSAVAQWLPLLADGDEKVRINAVTNLGRLKSAQALDPLAATLGGDRSPLVRAAAAKALAIIGDPRALLALQRAVQNDTDNDVRRTAQFAMEVIASR
jgi:HEAT repeat protein